MYHILLTIIFSLLTTELIKAEHQPPKDWCGTTGKPQSNYTAEQHCNDLKEALKTLKVDVIDSPINPIIDSLTQSLDTHLAKTDANNFFKTAILHVTRTLKKHETLFSKESKKAFASLFIPIIDKNLAHRFNLPYEPQVTINKQ